MSVSDAPPGEPSVDERRGAKLSGRSPLAAALGAMAPPLDLRILGRTLLHTAAVGLAAGLLGVAFFAGLEYTQSFLLEHIAGYTPLRAHGERIFGEPSKLILRPAVILILPAAGALLAGLLCMLAPETRGGGGDAMIHAFHHQGGVVRRRVIWIKALASILTLGSGGSGGREGPTMQMGGALGSWVGLTLKVSARERRILMLAGVAAGMAAVFRTPLGAALLAAEVLYRDDFEAEALVPAVLASVISYSVVISIFGESILFAHATRYPFVPKHLPLYALLAVLVAAVASLFLSTLRGVQKVSARLPLPMWARPAIGGLALSVVAVPLILLVGGHVGSPGHALGILGGGYGAAQIAITGTDWLPTGWRGAELLLFLCGVKLIATSLTIGTGGSAGDFGPSLVLGGLFGGAFGRAAAALLHDPTIDPGAFAHGNLLWRPRPRPGQLADHGLRDGRELRPARPADARGGDRIRRLAKEVPVPRAGTDARGFARPSRRGFSGGAGPQAGGRRADHADPFSRIRSRERLRRDARRARRGQLAVDVSGCR
jgi:CIC family chloride channel protein